MRDAARTQKRAMQGAGLGCGVTEQATAMTKGCPVQDGSSKRA